MEKQKLIIDGIEFEMGYLNPMACIKHFKTLLKIVSPVLGSIAETAFKNKSLNSVLDEKIDLNKALSQMFENWQDKDIENLINDLKVLSTSKKENTTLPLSASFDGLFTGKPSMLFKWLKWGIEVQFKDFFSEVKNQIAGGQE